MRQSSHRRVSEDRMSYKSIRLNVWRREGHEERIYIDTRFVDYRHGLGPANGDWIKSDDSGMCKFSGRPRYDGEGRPGAYEKLSDYLALNGLSFSSLLERIAECQTKGGHFSYAQYEKRYAP